MIPVNIIASYFLMIFRSFIPLSAVSFFFAQAFSKAGRKKDAASIGAINI